MELQVVGQLGVLVIELLATGVWEQIQGDLWIDRYFEPLCQTCIPRLVQWNPLLMDSDGCKCTLPHLLNGYGVLQIYIDDILSIGMLTATIGMLYIAFRVQYTSVGTQIGADANKGKSSGRKFQLLGCKI